LVHWQVFSDIHRTQISPSVDSVFKQEWSSVYAGDGDKALSSRDYDRALHLYSAVIDLDSATDIIFANRCRVRLAKKEWEEGLLDAQKVG
jgi:hypothetical protein